MAFVLLFSLAHKVKAQDTFYDIDSIQRIDIFFSASNWDSILDANVASETYYAADQVIINGVFFFDVGVKYKGNSSYSPTRAKNPFHLKLDYLLDQNYQGHEDIKLGNCFSDPSMIREVSTYKILRQYMDGPRCNFAEVYINGSYWGLYTNSEDVGNSFVENHYYGSCGTFIKCNPTSTAPGSQGSGLFYISPDSTQYYTQYEIQSDYGWTDLVNLCDTVNNHPGLINDIFDVDRALWMFAYNNVLVNLDSYSGAIRQNYYLYRNHQNQWIPTVWDLNQNYGSFINNGISQLSFAQMQTMTPDLHFNDGGWPLIKGLLGDSMYRRMYLAHMRTINNENYLNADYKVLVDSLRLQIDPLVQTDPHLLTTLAQYQTALTATGNGNGAAGVYSLMDARANYLNTHPLLTPTAPTISNVTPIPGAPAYMDPVIIQARVSNETAGSVWAGYRVRKSDRFYRIPLYDDGMHGDSAAGDHIYANSIYASSLKIQYYIYAENSNAGMFSPERAEHEFYTITPTLPFAGGGDIVLNEVMADNASIITNEECKFRDWIELYNRTNQPLALGNLYLSDNPTDLLKWKFPASSIIQPQEHLLVWADDNDNTWVDLHANFNLSSAVDRIFLSDSLGNILDSVSWISQTSDISLARCPDATGNFASTLSPTPRSTNICSFAGLDDLVEGPEVLIYPNPASTMMTVVSKEVIDCWDIYDIYGKLIRQSHSVTNRQLSLDISSLAPGSYFFRMNGSTTVRFAIQ